MNGTSPTLWLQDDRGGKEVADALWNHRGVRNLADLPRIAGQSFLPEEVADPSLCIEGAVRRVAVNAYERDPESRRQCIAVYGTTCCVCGFSFAAVYGEVADGYIHVHHLRALSEVREAHAVDPVTDLRPVCPNCHAVIHHRAPAFSIEEVREFLRH
jgi:predicted HNH restriction endonuclease